MTTSSMTSSEIGILWSQYIQNSISLQMIKYFHEIVEDNEIHDVVNDTLVLIEKVKQDIEHFFQAENIPVPDGFTDNDVNLKAPRL